MPNIEGLDLGNAPITDMDEIGEQRGAAKQPLPPGSYQFEVSEDQRPEGIWTKSFDTPAGKRASLLVSLLVTHSAKAALVGEQRQFMVGGRERNRAKKGQPKREVSDLQFFYRDALAGVEKPKDFLSLCRATEKALAKAAFGADVEWSAFCNKNDVRWIYDESTQAVIEDPAGTKGCGANFYQSQLANQLKGQDGEWIGDRITCTCGANLRVRDEITRYRKILGK